MPLAFVACGVGAETLLVLIKKGEQLFEESDK